MNNKLSISCIILIIAQTFFSCRGPVKDESKSNELASSMSFGEKYSINTKESSITWKGSMLVGTNSHTGYISISQGELNIEKGQITGGKAIVDMNTIEDENHDRENGLVDHLKAPDFFEVKKFPVSTFEFTKGVPTNGENKNVSGNLTIKGITHLVNFPAQIEIKDGIVKMNGKLVIDRTKWGVVYKSGKFYDLLADQTMSDNIEFQIKVVAKK